MITLTICSVGKNKDPKGGRIICPACLSDIYVFYDVCPDCSADIFEAKAVASLGLHGRIAYYKHGWPEMDKMAHERLKERREVKQRSKH